MYRALGAGRDDGRTRIQIGRSPPRRRRTPEGENKFCIYCKVQISSARLFDEHRDSPVHKQKEILIGKAISDGLQYCYTCEKIFPSKLALDAHCLMTRHKPLYRVDELQGVANQSTEAPVEQSTTENRRARDEKERQDIVLKLNKVRGDDEDDEEDDEDDDGGDDVQHDNRNVNNFKKPDANIVNDKFCQVCNVDCMNASNYKIHVESWRHRSEVDKKRDEEVKKFEERKKYEEEEEEAEKKMNSEEVVERKKVPEHLTEKAIYLCEICSIASTTESAYLDHLRNRKHFRQVAQMRRPYKCYFCSLDFNVARDFNYHLESKVHMDNAFNKEEKPRTREKDDEWVERKAEKRDGSSSKGKDGSRSGKKDDRSRRSWQSEKKERRESRSKQGKKDSRKTETKESGSKHADARKVEIVNSPGADNGIKDLREKLTAQKILVTKSNTPEKNIDQTKVINEAIHSAEETNDEKLSVEKDFEINFQNLVKEFGDDTIGLQEHLTKAREEDINSYQKYERDYRELTQEEEFIRQNLDGVEEGDIRREEYIHDMMRIQSKLQEVRRELELREMMIIKRESLYRDAFPDNAEKQVEESEKPYVYDYNHGNVEDDDGTKDVEDNNIAVENTDNAIRNTDLRIKLERERLMKRLAPELESIDPTLREKLLSVILDKEKIDTVPSIEPKIAVDTRQVHVIKDEETLKKQTQMDLLAKREKELEKELAVLKSNDKKKKIIKSLVPQYDDVDDKKKDIKKRPRKRSPSSESSSSSSSSGASRDRGRKDKKERRRSSSNALGKSKPSASADKNRRKRRRSISRERDKDKRKIVKGDVKRRKKRDEEKKKRIDRTKTEKKKVVKMSVKSKEKVSKLSKVGNPLREDNDSDIQEINDKGRPITVIGSSPAPPPISNQQLPQIISNILPIQTSNTPVIPPQRKEQFSFWKNPVVVAPQATNDSLKEDVWDIAFSGAQEEEGSPTLNLFNSSNDAKQLPVDILSILKSVAPIIQQTQQHSKHKRFANISQISAPTSSTSNSFRNTNSYEREKLNAPPIKHQETHNVPNRDKVVTEGIRSILKKISQPVPTQHTHEDLVNSEVPQSVIPGLDAAPLSPHPAFVSRGSENIKRSSLKTHNKDSFTFNDLLPETSKPYYNNSSTYSSTVENGEMRAINNQSPMKDNYSQMQPLKDDPQVHNGSNVDPYERVDQNNVSNEELLRSNNSGDNETLMRARDKADYEYRRDISTSSERPNSYDDIDAYRKQNVPIERERPERLVSPALDGASSKGARQSVERSYDYERNLRPEMDPYLRSEVTHVIDYHYIRDTRVLPPRAASYEKNIPPTSTYEERQPVRYPGETDDEYYARFERFYELNRRKEQQNDLRRERELLPRRFDAERPNPDARIPTRGEYYRQVDERFDDRSPRAPEPRHAYPESYSRPRSFDDRDRIPPLGERRTIDESHRRVEIGPNRRTERPFLDEGRDYDHTPYKVVEAFKRTEGGLEPNNPERRTPPPYRRPDYVENRTPELGRDLRDGRESDLQNLRNQPRSAQPILSASEFNAKFQDY